MDLQAIANGVLAYLVAPSIIVGIAAYLVKTGLEHSLSNSAKKYQADLERAAFAYQTKFSLYYQKQAEVIGQLYSLLVIAQQKTELAIRTGNGSVGLKTESDRFMDAEASLTELRDYYLKNLIYVDLQTSSDIKSILADLMIVELSTSAKKMGTEQEDHDKYREMALDTLYKTIPKALDSLQNKLRAILAP